MLKRRPYFGTHDIEAIIRMVICLCVGVIPGAQLGAYISHKIRTTTIIKILTACLGLAGVRIFLLAVL